MTYEQIIALTEKGFTPVQVMQLAGVRDSPADPEPAPEAPPADPEPAPEAPPADPEPAPEAPPASPDLSELLASVKTMGQQLAALTKANQEANIKNIIREDSPRGETADDILAGIIHPPMNEEKGGNNK